MTMTDFDPASHPDLTPNEVRLVREVHQFTIQYFQNPKFDASHDIHHVMRVVRNAICILDSEKQRRVSQSNPSLDTAAIILGALLHDVDDKKYKEATDIEVSLAKQELLRLGVSEERATMLQDIVDGVSYSSEIRNPDKVKALIGRIPELAVVQDADRLDAIGAVGIGRCFTFGGSKRVRSLDDSIDHFNDKLLKLQGMMKTESGKLLAAERSRRVRDFMLWWQDETGYIGHP